MASGEYLSCSSDSCRKRTATSEPGTGALLSREELAGGAKEGFALALFGVASILGGRNLSLVDVIQQATGQNDLHLSRREVVVHGERAAFSEIADVESDS